MIDSISVLDHGLVTLRNVSGPTRRSDKWFDADDVDPANSARMSFGQMDSGRTREQDLKLAEYLMKNHHCYHPEMEVLTTSGWRKWGDLGKSAEFLVPDPQTKTYLREVLAVKSFHFSGDLCVFSNRRMRYAVAPNHTMYFKGKYQKEYARVPASGMYKWGWFAPTLGHSLPKEDVDMRAAFVGFYLGDGSYGSLNRISFHLKKMRKRDYLEMLLDTLDICYKITPSSTYRDAVVYWVTTPPWLEDWLLSVKARSSDKQIHPGLLSRLNSGQLVGLLDGLLQSDGHIRKDRPQLEFSSSSPELLKLVQDLGAMLGYEAHQDSKGMVHLHHGGTRVTLESRKHCHAQRQYAGPVLCTTTSTGLLAVRGDSESWGFICGNSTPLEMIQVWLEFKLPIFVARQLIRHRTQSINEISARYTKLPAEWYIPNLDVICGKAESNKQGRSALQHAEAEWFQKELDSQCDSSYRLYELSLAKGIAPEIARTFLHVNHYTHWLSSMNLHNLMHFLSLRTHPHAQYEARVYAEAVLELLDGALPELMQLYRRYYV